MCDRRLHPWDERIGADASITKVTRGKKVFSDRDTFASSINLPLSRPSLEPVRRCKSSASGVSSDEHIWKTYQSSINEYGNGTSNPAIQRRFRANIRDRLNALKLDMEHTHSLHLMERSVLAERHRAHQTAERSVFRERCATKGIEGLKKPSLRSPEPPERVSDDLVADFVKKMTPSLPSNIEIHRPFGPPIGSKCEPAQRWVDKTFS